MPTPTHSNPSNYSVPLYHSECESHSLATPLPPPPQFPIKYAQDFLSLDSLIPPLMHNELVEFQDVNS